MSTTTGRWLGGVFVGLFFLMSPSHAWAGVAEPGTWLRLPASTGAVSAVAVSPAEPNRVYAGTADGVYRSDDGGGTWTRANLGLDFSLINCLTVAESPGEILYAGTAGGGVFRSDDLGESWRAANLGAEGRILTVQVVRSNAANAYAIARTVVRTQQGGTYWYNSASGLGPSVNALALARSDDTTLYAVADFFNRDSGAIFTSVFQSLNGGETWSLDAPEEPLVLPRFQETILVVDPTDSRIAYVGSQAGLFRRSTEGTWEGVVLSPGAPARIRAVAISPTSPATVFVAADRAFFVSSDGGQTYSEFLPPGGDFNRVYAMAVGPVQQTPEPLSPDAFPGTVFAATQFGLFRSSVGGHWELLSQGLPPSSALGFAFDPASPLTVYRNSNRGLIKSTLGGLHGGEAAASLVDYQRARRVEFEISKVWTEPDSGIAEVFVDPANPRRILVASNGLFLSEDGGRRFSPRLSEQVNALAFSRSSPRTLYAATSGTGLLKSVDGGVSWTASANGLPNDDFGGPESPRTIFEVAVDPFNTSIVYAGSRFGVHKSVDGGANWSAPICCPFLAGASAPATVFVGAPNVVSLAFDPSRQGTIYAGLNPDDEYSARVYKTIDGGATWQPSFTGLPERVRVLVAVDPKNNSTVYAGTWGFGVYRSVDGGSHWQPLNEGLENLFVKSLEFDFSGRLHAGTEGGLFQLQPDPPTEPAPVRPIQNFEGNLQPSGEVVLTVGLFRTSPNSTVPVETTFVETLPEGLTLVNAEADRGELIIGPSLNSVTWTGALAVRMSAEIRLRARIDEETEGRQLLVQGVAFLSNGAFALSGGSQTPGEPTVLQIGDMPSAGRSFFVPSSVGVANSFVGVAAANLGTVATTPRVQAHTSVGSLVSEFDSNPLVSFGQTTFIAGVAADGGDSVVVSGLQGPLDGFFLIGDESLDRLDGIGGRLTDAQTLVFPFARPSGPGRAVLSVFNPDSVSSSNAVVHLINPQGESVAEASLLVAPLGNLTVSPADLFGGAIVAGSRLTLEADRPLRGFELELEDRSFAAAPGFSPVWSDRLWSPHFFFDGDGGSTKIRAINTSPKEAHLKFRIVDDHLGLIAEPEMTLAGGALAEYDLRELSGLPPEENRQGYVEIETDGGAFDGIPLQASVLALAVFTGADGALRSNLPLAARGSRDVAFLQVAQSEELGLFQGLAVVAPEGADLEFSAYDEQGRMTARKELNLAAGGRFAGLLNDPLLFGPGFQQSGGILRVRATSEVIAYSLFGGAHFLAAVESSQVPTQ